MSDVPRKHLPSYVTQGIRGWSLQGIPNTHLNYIHKKNQVKRESFC